MHDHYTLSLVALCLAAVCEFWFMGVLLVTRQGNALLLFCIMAGVFWCWCLWGYFLRKRRAGLYLAGCCLAATLVLGGLYLLDMLDKSGVTLLGSGYPLR